MHDAYALTGSRDIDVSLLDSFILEDQRRDLVWINAQRVVVERGALAKAHVLNA
jgi:hypothetical protein